MKIVAIIQARTGSTRLPGKVMIDIAGRPMLWHVINRVKQAKKINEVIIATSRAKENEQILELASKMNVKSYAGSEDDVLDRYYQTATANRIDIIVRITADCPLIDPNIIDRAIGLLLDNDFDYVSNTINPTYPDGLDVWVFSFNALKKAWKEAKLLSEREHVTPYIWKNPQLFKIKNFENDKDFSYMRWTVDEECDLQFVREIYKRLYKEGKVFLMEDVLRLLEKHPELTEINKDIMRDEGYLKSLKEDRII